MSKSHEPKEKNEGARAGVPVRDAARGEKPVSRTFPGPRGAADALRVAINRNAYAELVAHAKSLLDVEVCGVLAGQICEDDEGAFVHVEAVIRGTSAGEGNTHVTFTQATWTAIHKTLEHDHPRLKIVGWYHTHPGFGVEFSEMDLFIQRNFFAGAAQIALVTDPLNGDVAICTNTAGGIQYIGRFWVDGREQQCRVPKSEAASPGAESAAAPASTQALETRVSQLLQAVDELRNFHYKFMMSCGIVFCFAVVAAAGYAIYRSWTAPLEPPKVNQIVPVPVQVGDKTVFLGVGIMSWEVPPELNAMMLKLEEAKREAEEKAAKDEADKTNSPAPAPNARPGTNSAPAKPL